MNRRPLTGEKLERYRASVRSASYEPAIAQQIGKFLANPTDRSRLVTANNFLATRNDHDRLCLPSVDIFRTQPENNDCGKWTVSEPADGCCVQSDTQFLGAIASIMAGAHPTFHEDRIAREIKAWMTRANAAVMSNINRVNIDLSTGSFLTRNRNLLKFAIATKTEAPIGFRIFKVNQSIDLGAFDLSKLRGVLHLYPGRYFSSVSYASVGEILADPPTIRHLIVDCPIIVPPAIDDSAVAIMIDDVQRPENDNFRYELTFSPAINVYTVAYKLADELGFAAWDWDYYNDSSDVVGIKEWGQATLTADTKRNKIIVTINTW